MRDEADVSVLRDQIVRLLAVTRGDVADYELPKLRLVIEQHRAPAGRLDPSFAENMRMLTMRAQALVRRLVAQLEYADRNLPESATELEQLILAGLTTE